MIIRYKTFIFTLSEIWFKSKSYDLCKVFQLCSIKYSLKMVDLPLFYKREVKYTLIHDLSVSEDALFQSFSRDTRNQIIRAKNTNVNWKINQVDLDEFVSFYNMMAEKKQIQKMTKKRILKYNLDNLTIISAYIGDELIIIHVYIHDEDIARALYSVSKIYQTGDKEKRKLIGFINKLLHWESMKYFKSLNYKIYDFGGYGNDKSNKSLAGVDRFKKSFNGKIVEVYNYYSLAFRFLLYLKSLLT